MTGPDEQIAALKKQGDVFIRANRLNDAKDAYTRIVLLDPDDADAWYVLSNIHGKLGNIDDVEACCRRAIALRPDYHEPYINLGHVKLMQHRYDEALHEYQTAIRINPALPAVYFNIGNILRDLGNTDLAEPGCRAQQSGPNIL